MSVFTDTVTRLFEDIDRLHADQKHRDAHSLGARAYVLGDDRILCEKRDNGDSRYPYGKDGFNFWAYASGYMHANEGLFSWFLRAAEGAEPNIAYFIVPEGGEPVSLFTVPNVGGAVDLMIERYTVFSPTAVYYLARIGDLRAALRVYVREDRRCCFSLSVTNTGTSDASFRVVSYMNPFFRNQIMETGEDRWFKKSEVVEVALEDALPAFLFTVNEDKDRYRSVSHYGTLRTVLSGAELLGEYAVPSRNYLVGGCFGSLHGSGVLNSDLSETIPSVCMFTETAVGAHLADVRVKAGGTLRYDQVLSVLSDEKQVRAELLLPVEAEDIDKEFERVEQCDRCSHAGLTVDVHGESPLVSSLAFNAFFEHLKRQVEFCSLIKGYVQLSPNSLIGIRDVYQALEGYLFWHPARARDKMLEALGFTAPDGRCFRQYSLPSTQGAIGRMDLRLFIDQGLWVINAFYRYLCVTGDYAVLYEECGYHEIVNEGAGTVQESSLKDSVWKHLIRITDFLLKHLASDTGCLRAMYGDWNDALDGLGISEDPAMEYGTGVSVMASLQLYECLQQMINIEQAAGLANGGQVGTGYRSARRELGQALKKHAVEMGSDRVCRILHGWGDQYGYKVGSCHDSDGVARDGLTANAFWVMSGLIRETPELKNDILSAFGRLDSKYGYKTFAPAFPPNAEGVGRIGKLPAGTAENAAAYVHATTFAIASLFMMGDGKKAWEQIVKILPFTKGHENLSHSPFVMPNSYGENAALNIDGQNMNDWQTGSSNVLFKVLLRYVLGFEPELEGLRIQPAGGLPFESFKFSAQCRNTPVHIEYVNKQVGRRRFLVNGEEMVSEFNEELGVETLWLPAQRLMGVALEISVID